MLHILFYSSFLDVRFHSFYFDSKANLGERVTLNNGSKVDDKSAITWLFNKTPIVDKQPGKDAIILNKNYEIENDGMFLVIPNMTLFLQGEYERLVGNDSTLFALHGM